MTTAFHRFNELPPELRVQIWIFSLPPPSLVIEKNLHVKHHAIEWGHMLKLRPVSKFLTPPCRFIPAPLHVCRESRSEFLNVDEGSRRQDARRNGHDVYNHYVLKSGQAGGFVSLGSDEVVMSMDTIYNRWQFPFSLLRNMVLVTDSTYFFPSRAADFLLPFENLRVLTLVLNINIIGCGAWENRVFPPEIGGQFDLEGFSEVRRIDLRDEIKRINGAFRETERRKRGKGGWRRPVVKWRLWEQFVRGMREDEGCVHGSGGSRPKLLGSWEDLNDGTTLYWD